MTRRLLLILITVNAALYAALAGLYPLAHGLLKPRMTWAQQNAGAPLVGIMHAVIYFVLFSTYAVAAQRALRIGVEASADLDRSAEIHISIRFIIIGWLAFCLIGLFTFPGESADIFDYLFRGRMLTEYNLSPLNVAPVTISNMPFHRYVSWSDWVDAYGPLWEYVSAAVAFAVRQLASPAELLVHINQTCDVQPAVCALLTKYITGYRLLAIGLAGTCGYLVWWIVKRQTSNSGLAAGALLTWLWNPLVITSTALGAHNDVLMIAFVLLAVGLAQHDRWLLALFALFAASLVKITALVLLPVVCLWMVHWLGWRRAIVTMLVSLAVALPISFGLYAPLGGWATLPRNLYERSLLSANSLGELLYRFMRESVGLARPNAQQVAARVSLVAFLGASIPILLVAWRRKETPKGPGDSSGFWLRIMIVVALVYLALGSFWFQAWYLTLPVALVALSASLPASRLRAPRLARVVLAYCAGAMIATAAADYVRAGATLPSWRVSLFVVVVILLPVAIAWITTASTASTGSTAPPTSTPSRSSR